MTTTTKLDQEKNQQKLFFNFSFSQSKTSLSRRRKQQKLFFDFFSFFLKSTSSRKRKQRKLFFDFSSFLLKSKSSKRRKQLSWSQNWVLNMSNSSTRFNSRVEQKILFDESGRVLAIVQRSNSTREIVRNLRLDKIR
jgi:hypothetical protein